MNNNSFAMTLNGDFYRLKKLKSVWISLIIMFALIFLTFAIYWIGIKVIESQPPEQMPEIDSTLQFMDSLIINMLYGSSSVANVELFIAIVACIFIGKDFSCGYITLTTARGTKRTDTYFSKWIRSYAFSCSTSALPCS